MKENERNMKLQKIKERGNDKLPPGFRVKLIIEFELLPDEKVNEILQFLNDEIESGKIKKFNLDLSYYFDYIREVGLENIMQRGTNQMNQ